MTDGTAYFKPLAYRLNILKNNNKVDLLRGDVACWQQRVGSNLATSGKSPLVLFPIFSTIPACEAFELGLPIACLKTHTVSFLSFLLRSMV